MKAILCTLAVAALVSTAPAFAEVKNDHSAPEFTLTDIQGKSHALSSFKGKTVVLEWVNHGCPFVKKHYDSGNMQKLQKEATGSGVVWLSICSSAAGKQGHMTPEEWKKATAEKGTGETAVLLDADGKVGKLYAAKTTPHMYIIDAAGKLVYQGAIDSNSSANKDDIAGATNYVRAALAEIAAGKPVTTGTTKPYGCSVKY
jgi:hypothetical protein